MIKSLDADIQKAGLTTPKWSQKEANMAVSNSFQPHFIFLIVQMKNPHTLLILQVLAHFTFLSVQYSGESFTDEKSNIFMKKRKISDIIIYRAHQLYVEMILTTTAVTKLPYLLEEKISY